ncbi:MAG: prepilin-type N-terminal cleavage/methylation domain-containing protein [Mariprofundaceae bacterium]|nr:prepilin-type N-terminal cleavage/methylation domain-containing protein [Mariprofundaceae bacterium]
MLKEKGFSLLEMMLVLALLALVSGIVLPNLFLSDEQQLHDEARRLQQVLRTANRETRMSAIPMRWTAYEKSYAFEQLSPEGRWFPFQEAPFAEHVFHESVHMVEVQTQGESAFMPETKEAESELSDQKEEEPRVILGRVMMMPDGAMTIADVQLMTEAAEQWLEVRPGMSGIVLRVNE